MGDRGLGSSLLSNSTFFSFSNPTDAGSGDITFIRFHTAPSADTKGFPFKLNVSVGQFWINEK